MSKKTIVCDVEALYSYLKENNEILNNDVEILLEDDSYLVEDDSYFDIVRTGGTIPIICDGETHEFEKVVYDGEDFYSLIPTEDTGNHEVYLTIAQFEALSGK